MMDLSIGRSRMDRNNGRGERVRGEPRVPTCCFTAVPGATLRSMGWSLQERVAAASMESGRARPGGRV